MSFRMEDLPGWEPMQDMLGWMNEDELLDLRVVIMQAYWAGQQDVLERMGSKFDSQSLLDAALRIARQTVEK